MFRPKSFTYAEIVKKIDDLSDYEKAKLEAAKDRGDEIKRDLHDKKKHGLMDIKSELATTLYLKNDDGTMDVASIKNAVKQAVEHYPELLIGRFSKTKDLIQTIASGYDFVADDDQSASIADNAIMKEYDFMSLSANVEAPTNAYVESQLTYTEINTKIDALAAIEQNKHLAAIAANDDDKKSLHSNKLNGLDFLRVKLNEIAGDIDNALTPDPVELEKMVKEVAEQYPDLLIGVFSKTKKLLKEIAPNWDKPVTPSVQHPYEYQLDQEVHFYEALAPRDDSSKCSMM